MFEQLLNIDTTFQFLVQKRRYGFRSVMTFTVLLFYDKLSKGLTRMFILLVHRLHSFITKRMLSVC